MIVWFELQNCLMKKKKTQQSLHFEKNKTALNAVENVLPRQVELNRLKQAKEETKNAPDLGSFALLRTQVWAQYLSLPYIEGVYCMV